MKPRIALLVSLGLGFSFVLAKPYGERRGTDIVHWHLTAKLGNPGLITNVVDGVTNVVDVSAGTGKVEIKVNQQGKADIQQFKLDAKGLAPTNQYHLLVLLSGDTNFTLISSFTTGTNGHGRVEFKRVGQAQNKGKGKGGPPHSLPDDLNPLYKVREVAVANTNHDVVLFTDFSHLENLHYLVKGNFTNDGVDADAAAQLHLQANKQRTHINIKASGLEATNATYQLALNSNVTATLTTDKKGRANFRTMLPAPYPILDLFLIQLLDGNTNSVLSFELPPAP